jgi:hypothetical protein
MLDWKHRPTSTPVYAAFFVPKPSTHRFFGSAIRLFFWYTFEGSADRPLGVGGMLGEQVPWQELRTSYEGYIAN